MFAAYNIGRVKPFLAKNGVTKNGGKLRNFTRESIYAIPLPQTETHRKATKETDGPPPIVTFVALREDTH